ncbi:MAG: hypothetical protein M1818_000548 [Claussenomyces sp. TS43310]|nr:MAG: hypothetical protein M1818_000548 [Claussenomyces sp. TS43310]
MSTFQPVNAGLAPESYARNGDETTPTTPRPSTAPQPQPSSQQSLSRADDAKTPTRATFGALATQRPLPVEPFPAAISVPESAEVDKKALARATSSYSTKSRDSEDVEMAESEGEEDGSEEESVNADGTRSTKKKKTQRFWCTDYPPCNLSFTRSEHLARHIRKHTGERPFQCHCSRRFSRLDNLRQHAQTVHVNEEIPGDSLAASGNRFQRQIRTERVRPPVGRSRASTAGSQSSQGRGHQRNSLSASSIGSIGSTYSQQDVRRRPPPLVMATDPRSRMSHENYEQTYRPNSPGGFGTPTSATFSTGQSSPRWVSGMASPISSHSRTASLYAGHRTPGRRLSVPSSANPFQSPSGYAAPPMTPIHASNQAFMSPGSSYAPSPTSSSHSRRESMSNAADEPWRRRTWHPETSNFTSRLVNVTTPNHYQATPPQPTRLPGIESFDPLPRPATPPARVPSPMMVDTPSRAPFVHTREAHDDRRSHPQWDMGLHRNLTRLDIAQGTPPADPAGAWASEANRAVQAQAEQTRAEHARIAPSVRFEQPYQAREVRAPAYPAHHTSAPPTTPRELKRHGWYNGPMGFQHDARRQRTSPEDSSSSEGVPGTPRSSYHAESNPSIVPSSSYTYTHDPRCMPGMQQEDPKGDGMLRLEALVAVATSEENATAAY